MWLIASQPRMVGTISIVETQKIIGRSVKTK